MCISVYIYIYIYICYRSSIVIVDLQILYLNVCGVWSLIPPERGEDAQHGRCASAVIIDSSISIGVIVVRIVIVIAVIVVITVIIIVIIIISIIIISIIICDDADFSDWARTILYYMYVLHCMHSMCYS